MNYERMWNQLTSDIRMQEQLSENIVISKLLDKIADIESAEEMFSVCNKNEEFSF